MTTKFSKAPWTYVDRMIVCAERGEYVCEVTGSAENEAHQADAHLISAAPDLYEALNRMVEAAVLQPECAHSREPDLCDDCAFEREKSIGLAASAARAALAKAEGRS